MKLLTILCLLVSSLTCITASAEAKVEPRPVGYLLSYFPEAVAEALKTTGKFDFKSVDTDAVCTVTYDDKGDAVVFSTSTNGRTFEINERKPNMFMVMTDDVAPGMATIRLVSGTLMLQDNAADRSLMMVHVNERQRQLSCYTYY